MHFEIGCRNRGRTEEFFSKLFGWKLTSAGPAAMIDTCAGAGINGHITSLGHEPFNYVTVYVQVDDLQVYLDKATTLGGRMLVPSVEIPAGAFTWLADPDGNISGLFRPQ